MKPTPALPQQDSSYQRLRKWISVGRFLPGQRLKIHDLAAQLGTGVMPVRSALQRLSAEGALVNLPHSGVTVPKLSAAGDAAAYLSANEQDLFVAGQFLRPLCTA